MIAIEGAHKVDDEKTALNSSVSYKNCHQICIKMKIEPTLAELFTAHLPHT
jgi:hypothetical protein